jgi:hypothetical protein
MWNKYQTDRLREKQWSQKSKRYRKKFLEGCVQLYGDNTNAKDGEERTEDTIGKIRANLFHSVVKKTGL